MSWVKEYHLPAEDVNDETAIITELYYSTGDRVHEGDAIYSFETTKAVIDVTSVDEGFINYQCESGQELAVGTLVCEIADNKDDFRTVKKTVALDEGIRLTKKAQILAEHYGLKLESLGFDGVIREKDLIPFINDKKTKGDNTARCDLLDRDDDFIRLLLEDNSFPQLSSDQKVKRYRDAGHQIGENVVFGPGSVLIGNNIEVGDHVVIGDGTYIEVTELKIGVKTKIGSQCEIVGSRIDIGEHNIIANKINIDISGGRHPDSNLKTGRGCLIANEVYINICREVSLGDNVALSPRAMIFTHSYWQSVLEGYSSTFGPIHFEENSWLGASAQIMPNMKVGAGSIIMSNSLVVSDVKESTMVGGVPATVIKEEIKKNFGSKKTESILIKLFQELQKWLHWNHFDVEEIDSQSCIINKAGEQKRCVLWISPNSKIPASATADLVISTIRPENLPVEVDTLFIINEMKVEGSLGSIQLQIIEFFRRKGMRLYA